jgi:hypothetical protein
MRRLVAVDEAAVVADYEADVTVNAICASRNIDSSGSTGSSIAMRSRAGNRTRRSCRNGYGNASTDYVAGVPTEEIAARHGVSHGTLRTSPLRT